MPVIRLPTFIQAPPEVCSDLSRSIELHLAPTADTGERAVAGRTSGSCEAGDTVTWSAVHFGIRQRLNGRIAQMDDPRSFRDEQLRGALNTGVTGMISSYPGQVS